MPSTMSIPCQVQNYHGNLNFTTNAAGFGRIHMLLGRSFGNIVADGTPTLNETSAVTFTNLLIGAGDLINNPSRVVSAGM